MQKIDLLHPLSPIEPTPENFNTNGKRIAAFSEERKLKAYYNKLQERLFFLSLATGGAVGLLAIRKIVENADMAQFLGGAMLTGLVLGLVGYSLPPRLIISAMASRRAEQIRNLH